MIWKQLEGYELALVLIYAYRRCTYEHLDQMLREVFGIDSLERLDAQQAILDDYPKFALEEADEMLVLSSTGKRKVRALLREHSTLREEILNHQLLVANKEDIYLASF